MSPQAEYPRRTARYLSWSALQFITRPSPRLLAWSCASLMLLLFAAAVALPSLQMDLRVPASSVVAADPSTLPAVAIEDGTVDAWLAEPGALVKKAQPIALLQLGPGGEQIPHVVQLLQDNKLLLGAIDTMRRVPPGLETGSSLDSFPDQNVRERAVALEAAHHKLEAAIANHLEFADARDQFLNVNGQLRGALMEYLERHQVRAPADGTLLQFEQPLHGTVLRGQPVATLLPREAVLVARMTVEARNSAELAVGQTVRHRLEAFPYEEYGVFGGTVTRIEQAPDAKSGVVYVVKATIAPPKRLPKRLAARLRLMQGMRGDSSIVVGRKRLLDLAVEALFGKR